MLLQSQPCSKATGSQASAITVRKSSLLPPEIISRVLAGPITVCRMELPNAQVFFTVVLQAHRLRLHMFRESLLWHGTTTLRTLLRVYLSLQTSKLETRWMRTLPLYRR